MRVGRYEGFEWNVKRRPLLSCSCSCSCSLKQTLVFYYFVRFVKSPSSDVTPREDCKSRKNEENKRAATVQLSQCNFQNEWSEWGEGFLIEIYLWFEVKIKHKLLRTEILSCALKFIYNNIMPSPLPPSFTPTTYLLT